MLIPEVGLFLCFVLAAKGQRGDEDKFFALNTLAAQRKEGRKWSILCVVRGFSTLFARDLVNLWTK